MKNSLEIIKQFILRSDEDTDDVWPAYLKISDHFKNVITEGSVIPKDKSKSDTCEKGETP